MAPLSDRGALLAAWNGLSVPGSAAGWVSIPLGSSGGLEIRAAKVYPEGIEGFLVGFPGAAVPSEHNLPQAKGFRSTRLTLQGVNTTWFAVIREDGGSLDLFASMTSDVLALLLGSTDTSGALLRQVIARVAAWQRFMERGGSGLLRPEEEIGLFGELAVLRALIAGEADKTAIVEAWKGPFGALHDFRVGTGAIEIKTAIIGVRAHAQISSLEQLDTSVVDPIFLTAVRLVLADEGISLGEMVNETVADCSGEPSAKAPLLDRLLSAGFRHEDNGRYTRRFAVKSLRSHRVDRSFPRLTTSTVPPAIVAAGYTIDLDRLEPENTSIKQAFDLVRNARP